MIFFKNKNNYHKKSISELKTYFIQGKSILIDLWDSRNYKEKIQKTVLLDFFILKSFKILIVFESDYLESGQDIN